ncbi:MAG: B12-binding domain-containing radical SAM protein, partial [Archaeoglobaceae archaeon]
NDFFVYLFIFKNPEVEIYKEAKEKNLLLTEDYEKFTAGKPVMKTLIPAEELAKFLRKCYLKFYLRPKFILREIRKGHIGLIFSVIKKAIKSNF